MADDVEVRSCDVAVMVVEVGESEDDNVVGATEDEIVFVVVACDVGALAVAVVVAGFEFVVETSVVGCVV